MERRFYRTVKVLQTYSNETWAVNLKVKEECRYKKKIVEVRSFGII